MYKRNQPFCLHIHVRGSQSRQARATCAAGESSLDGGGDGSGELASHGCTVPPGNGDLGKCRGEHTDSAPTAAVNAIRAVLAGNAPTCVSAAAATALARRNQSGTPGTAPCKAFPSSYPSPSRPPPPRLALDPLVPLLLPIPSLSLFPKANVLAIPFLTSSLFRSITLLNPLFSIPDTSSVLSDRSCA